MTEAAYETLPELESSETRIGASTVVMKFGGTSVADPEKIRASPSASSPQRAGASASSAVVSAMGQHTDELVALAHQVSPRPKPRELDMLISVGERISCALVAMAISDLGMDAISLTGSQAGIVTDTVHGKAKIVEVRRTGGSTRRWTSDRIVLVAGFQGVSTEFDITTLGRGGSDTTAVALAAALGADACEIYTDVDGVFTADPRLVPGARKAPRGQLRGDARDGGLGREGASATLGRVRPEPRRQAPRALHLHQRRRARGSGRRTSGCSRKR